MTASAAAAADNGESKLWSETPPPAKPTPCSNSTPSWTLCKSGTFQVFPMVGRPCPEPQSKAFSCQRPRQKQRWLSTSLPRTGTPEWPKRAPILSPALACLEGTALLWRTSSLLIDIARRGFFSKHHLPWFTLFCADVHQTPLPPQPKC